MDIDQFCFADVRQKALRRSIRFCNQVTEGYLKRVGLEANKPGHSPRYTLLRR